MEIRVVIPRGSHIRNKITDKYTDLYRQNVLYHFTHPTYRPYSIADMRRNIRNALSVSRQTISERQLREPILNSWAAMGWKAFLYSNWYFAVAFSKDRKGAVIAVLQDCCFNGDYHNDTMVTKPYDESKKHTNKILTESQLRDIISEVVHQIIKQVINEKTLLEHRSIGRRRPNRVRNL